MKKKKISSIEKKKIREQFFTEYLPEIKKAYKTRMINKNTAVKIYPNHEGDFEYDYYPGASKCYKKPKSGVTTKNNWISIGPRDFYQKIMQKFNYFKEIDHN